MEKPVALSLSLHNSAFSSYYPTSSPASFARPLRPLLLPSEALLLCPPARMDPRGLRMSGRRRLVSRGPHWRVEANNPSLRREKKGSQNLWRERIRIDIRTCLVSFWVRWSVRRWLIGRRPALERIQSARTWKDGRTDVKPVRNYQGRMYSHEFGALKRSIVRGGENKLSMGGIEILRNKHRPHRCPPSVLTRARPSSLRRCLSSNV